MSELHMVLLTVLLLAIRCRACSFLVGSYNLTAEHSSHQLSAANLRSRSLRRKLKLKNI